MRRKHRPGISGLVGRLATTVGEDGVVKVEATADSNPKDLEDQPRHTAPIEARLDVRSGALTLKPAAVTVRPAAVGR